MPPRHPIFGLTVAVLIGLCVGATPSAAQTDVIGQWSLVAPLPYYPVHTHMLPTGKVMIWQGLGVSGGVSGGDAWDPANQSVSSLSKPDYNVFCSGHSFLADGTLFVAGGHISNFVGLSRASTYNPFTDEWSNLPNMNAGRWYPTTTVLANGDVLVVSGYIDPTIGVNTLPQVFQVATGTWRSLTNAQLAQQPYAMMLLAPNGRVFDAGPTPTTRYLDTSGTGAWSFVANRVGGVRDYGSAVMYAPGKVLVMGGDSPPKNTAEVIDLNTASPSWLPVGSMLFGRRHLNATLLPDGKVLVTGGTAAPGFDIPAATWMRQSFGTRRPKTGRRSPAARGTPARTTLRHSSCRMAESLARAGTITRKSRSTRRRISSREPGRRSRRRRPASPMGSPSSSEHRTPRRSPRSRC